MHVIFILLFYLSRTKVFKDIFFTIICIHWKPFGGTGIHGCLFSSVVERYPCKVVVASSILAGGLILHKIEGKGLLNDVDNLFNNVSFY